MKNLKDRNISPVLLSTQKSKNGQLDETWKVIITEIEPPIDDSATEAAPCQKSQYKLF